MKRLGFMLDSVERAAMKKVSLLTETAGRKSKNHRRLSAPRAGSSRNRAVKMWDTATVKPRKVFTSYIRSFASSIWLDGIPSHLKA